MILHTLCCFFIFVAQSPPTSASDEATLLRLDPSGLRVTKSVRVAPGEYLLPAPKGDGAVVILGDDLTVDFQGAMLIGAPPDVEPDRYVGRGIVIRGRNVTVKNVKVRGYKVGIFAEDSEGLTLEECDVSRNFRQRLGSTIEREDPSDWLFGHENDENEWLRYGAGIYLLRSPGSTIAKCRARNGQNGLCLVRCDHSRVVENDMSFMSGWGLAMWRSSECEIFNNKFDWCMRGYSHGIYARGQDSAGILVYEQCHRNLFAFNSATHSGDGFFLYAGNETLRKTGRGGCSENVVYQNDFSHAAANGIEATFSDGNIFVKNRLDECTHGIWAGYSYNTIIENNKIHDCENGISIEHGRRNRIAGNSITGARIGVNLWWDNDQDLLATPFCEGRDRCPSRYNFVVANRFEQVNTAVRLADNTESRVASNLTHEVEVPVHLVGNVEGTNLALTDTQRMAVKDEGHGAVTHEKPLPRNEAWQPLDIVARKPRLLGGRALRRAFLLPGAPRGRDRIFIDEWGPYDFSGVRLFPRDIRGGSAAALYVLAPDIPFTVSYVIGAIRVSPMEGDAPARLTAKAASRGLQPFRMGVTVGGESISVNGVLLDTPWDVAFYGWSEPDDPRIESDAWNRIVSSEPRARMTVPEIDFMWYSRPPADGVPADRFATVATTNVRLPGGTWRLQTVSDDGVRVFIDDRRVIDNWTHHGASTDEAHVELDEGNHRIRIEHFEIDGHAQLRFSLDQATR